MVQEIPNGNNYISVTELQELVASDNFYITSLRIDIMVNDKTYTTGEISFIWDEELGECLRSEPFTGTIDFTK